MEPITLEIAQHVGEENIFIFGKRTEELQKMREEGYDPRKVAESSEDLMRVLEAFEIMISIKTVQIYSKNSIMN